MTLNPNLPAECPLCEVKFVNACLHRYYPGDLMEIVDVGGEPDLKPDLNVYDAFGYVRVRSVDGSYVDDDADIRDLRPLTLAAAELLTIAKDRYVEYWQAYNRTRSKRRQRARLRGRFPTRFRPVRTRSGGCDDATQ
jgi:hypothetical protein